MHLFLLIMADVAGVLLCLLGAALCLASILPKWGGGSAADDASAMRWGVTVVVIGFGVMISAGVFL